MNTPRRTCFALAALAGLAPGWPGAAGAVEVVASIVPVHALVAGVMGTAGTPRLLVRAGGSPHDHALKPSDARALARADVVVRVDPQLETFLFKPLKTLAKSSRIVTLTGAPGVRLLTRDGGAPDPHAWLDPINAKAMVAAIVAALAAADPENAALYRNNGRSLAARLDALDAELATILAPVRTRPFIVFHDAFGYFVARYDLNTLGAVVGTAGQAPGARHLRAIRATIRERGVHCVFVEPQFEPKIAKTIVAGTGAKIAALDPIGADVTPGPGAYIAMMRNLARALADCLAG